MWKAEYWIYVGVIALAVFVAVKAIRGDKDTQPNYAGDPEFTNPFA